MFDKIRKNLGQSTEVSYKLHIHFSPHWFNILKKINQPKNQEDFKIFVDGLYRKYDEDRDLWGRSYNFIEYYDSISGLTIKSQETIFRSGKKSTQYVDEFGDLGYVFNSINLPMDPERSPDFFNEYSVSVSEDSILNNAFDKNFGGVNIFHDKKMF